MIKEVTLKSQDNHTLIISLKIENEHKASSISEEDEIKLKIKEWFSRNLLHPLKT